MSQCDIIMKRVTMSHFFCKVTMSFCDIVTKNVIKSQKRCNALFL